MVKNLDTARKGIEYFADALLAIKVNMGNKGEIESKMYAIKRIFE